MSRCAQDGSCCDDRSNVGIYKQFDPGKTEHTFRKRAVDGMAPTLAAGKAKRRRAGKVARLSRRANRK